MKEIILPMYSLLLTFRQDLLVFLAGLVVGNLGGRLLAVADPHAILGACLLLPTFINGFQAPFGRALAGADWLVANHNKHRIGVTGRENFQANPAAFFDGHVKDHFLLGAI